MHVRDLPTPSLVVDVEALDRNIATMAAAARSRLRPHVKAFKSTTLPAASRPRRPPPFCCATVPEIAGLAQAGVGADLLLANEVVDPADSVRWSSGRPDRGRRLDDTIEAPPPAGSAKSSST